METLIQDIRYALRTLSRRPGFSAVAILTLALAIGPNTALFSVIQGVLLRPLPYAEPEQLVQLYTSVPMGRGARFSMSYPDLQEMRKATDVFAGVGAYVRGDFNLAVAAEPREVQGAQASEDLFRVLGARPELGRLFAAAEQREPLVVLSHALWVSEYGMDSAVVGRSLTLDGQAHTVIGVMPPGFRFPDEQTALWLPVGRALMREPQVEVNRRWYFLNTVARLAPAVTPERLQARLALIAAQINAAETPQSGPQRVEVRVEGGPPPGGGGGPIRVGASSAVEFSAVPLRDNVIGNVRPALLMLFGAVALVLLIACANQANLFLARANARRTEVAVRRAIGAGRGRIVRQLLTESVVLALGGGAVGLLLSYWAVGALLAGWPDLLPRSAEIGVNGPVLAFSAGLSIVTGVLCGLVPALRAASPDVEEALRGDSPGSAGGRGRRRALRALVAGEIAVALVLLVGSGLLIRSFLRLTSVELGYDTKNVLAARIRLTPSRYPEVAQRREFFRQLTEQLSRWPDVQGTAVSSTLPLSGDIQMIAFNPQRIRPDDPEPFLASRMGVVSAQYFSVLRIPVLSGRAFEEGDGPGGPPVVVVNRRLANRLWPGDDPVGKTFPLAAPGRGAVTASVVGVVGDVRYASLDAPVMPEIYIPDRQRDLGEQLWVLLRSAESPLALVTAVREAVKRLDPQQPIGDLVSLDQMMSRSTTARRFNLTLLTTLAGLALFLALLGIYGITAYALAQRTREMGLRMAIGAEPTRLIRMLLGESALLVSAGVAVGLAGAAAASRALSTMLFGISAMDGVTFAGAALLLGAVALLATYLPARRLARLDPVKVLKSE